MENIIQLDEKSNFCTRNMPFFDISTIDYHWHDAFECIIVSSGTLYVEINGCPLILNQNEGCFINASALHYYKSLTQECVIDTLTIHPDFICPQDLYNKYIEPFIQHGLPYYLLEKDEKMNHLIEILLQQSTGYELLARNYVTTLFLELFKQLDYSYKNKDNKRIKETITWLKSRLDQQLSVEDISNSQHISTRECQRMFMKWLGRSPMEYLRRLRILLACELLKDTNLPIGDIASTLHFATASHFSKVFKDVIGCTPAMFRKHQKG